MRPLANVMTSRRHEDRAHRHARTSRPSIRAKSPRLALDLIKQPGSQLRAASYPQTGPAATQPMIAFKTNRSSGGVSLPSPKRSWASGRADRESTSRYRVSEHKVQRGELPAVYVYNGNRKGLRIKVKPDQAGLFENYVREETQC
jgi:hypothetical protein